MTKAEARKVYQQKRNLLSEIDIEEKSFEIFNQLQSLDIWELDTYHLFLPIAHKNEINTYTILQELEFLEKKITIPKVNNNKIDSILLQANTKITTQNPYKIPEPSNGKTIDNQALDLVFLPMLACDAMGQRVGYGKGYYDRLLATCREDVMKIGINFFKPSQDIIEDYHEADVPLDYCVWPGGIVSFNDFKS